MKSRIHDQFLRFRLEESDVRDLCRKGQVDQRVLIGQSELKFSILLSEGSPNVEISSTDIMVQLPQSWATNWDSDERVGFDFSVPSPHPDGLRVVVEKDFPCAHTADGRAVYGKPDRMN